MHRLYWFDAMVSTSGVRRSDLRMDVADVLSKETHGNRARRSVNASTTFLR